MRFRLHGIDPEIIGELPKTPEGTNYESEEWKDYFKLKSEYYESNPGVRFHANQFWWKHLWDYIYKNCDDILTKEDWINGKLHNWYEISEEKADKIADRLKDKMINGDAKKYAEKKKIYILFDTVTLARFIEFSKNSNGFHIR